MFKRTDFRGAWGLKGPVGILAVYFGVLFPAFHILFPQAQKWAPTIYPAYFGIMVTILILIRSTTWRQMGFHREHWKQSLIMGGFAGGLVMVAVPLFDLLIDATSMGQTELFSGADQRLSEETGEDSAFAVFILSTIFIALVEQGFLTGYVLQALFRKIKPALAVYLGGLIFALVHFDLQLGMFLLGLIASLFYLLTGSLVAPLIFQIACYTAGWLLAHHYPKVFTLLGFLF